MSHPSRSTSTLLLLLFAVPLILLAVFAGFGLLATFELSAWSQRLPWLVGYSLLGFGCLGGAGALVWSRAGANKAHEERPGR